MRTKWEKFTKEEVKELVKKATSWRNLAELMGYKADGGSSTRVKEGISERYPDIDVSHFTGQGWNKGHNSLEKIEAGENTLIMHSSTLRRALISERGNKCEKCGVESWNGKPITLEIHHIDGNHHNNELSNLMLLCPNCHSQTENYKSSNKKEKERASKITDEEFKEALEKSTSIHKACILLGINGTGGNYSRAYDIIEKYHVKIGSKIL